MSGGDRPLGYDLDHNPLWTMAEYAACADLKDPRRIIGRDEVGRCLVSTVFLFIDHSFGDGPPLLYETMVFLRDDWEDLGTERYSTREEAERGHAHTVAALRAKLLEA